MSENMKPKTHAQRIGAFTCIHWDALKIGRVRYLDPEHIEISFLGEHRIYSITSEGCQDTRIFMRRAADILGNDADYSALEAT